MIPKSMAPPNDFVFDEPEGRPFRLISIETEVDGSPSKLAGELYKHGFVCDSIVQAYGWSPAARHTHVGFLKKDGSVTGGELVLDRLNLTNKAHAEAMLAVYDRMRDLEKAGHIQYNPNCGGHIHIDAEGYGLFDTLRFMVTYGSVEEIVCRLAGAGKTYGHRTLFKGYDVANFGRGYANPVLKGPFRDLPHAIGTMLGQKRMSGVNLTHYKNTVCNGCGGAELQDGVTSYDEDGYARGDRVYDLKNCTCGKKIHTIEWRVWNSQGNPRILYAWVALMQAMHAYAWRPYTCMEYKDYEFTPALEWSKKPFENVTPTFKKKIQAGLEFMFSEYPLTSEEKDALAYSFMRTPYKEFGRSFFARLANTAYKAPAFENNYTARIGTREVVVNPAPFDSDARSPTQLHYYAGRRYRADQLWAKIRSYRQRYPGDAYATRRVNDMIEALGYDPDVPLFVER